MIELKTPLVPLWEGGAACLILGLSGEIFGWCEV